jgi:hypothetical protein
MVRVNKKAPPHYLVTVEGAYAYKDMDGEKKRKNYKYEIPVPVQVTAMIPTKLFDAQKQTFFWQDQQKTIHISDYGVLSYLIKEQRIQNRIRKECPAFIALLRHEITDLRGSSPEVQLPSTPHVLNKSQLTKFIKANGWPIDISLFPTLKDLREAVLNYKESPESYEVYETNRRRRGATGNAFTKVQEELESFYTSPTSSDQTEDETTEEQTPEELV